MYYNQGVCTCISRRVHWLDVQVRATLFSPDGDKVNTHTHMYVSIYLCSWIVFQTFSHNFNILDCIQSAWQRFNHIKLLCKSKTKNKHLHFWSRPCSRDVPHQIACMPVCTPGTHTHTHAFACTSVNIRMASLIRQSCLDGKCFLWMMPAAVTLSHSLCRPYINKVSTRLYPLSICAACRSMRPSACIHTCNHP